jgi:hypothetical protein
MSLKLCQQCLDVKDESQFRYIKYFRKHRVICKRCEANSRQKNKELAELHVQEHGVTPKAMQRLTKEAELNAQKLARECVIAELSPHKRERYIHAETAEILYTISMLLCAVCIIVAITNEGLRMLALPSILSGLFGVAGRRFFRNRYVEPVNLEIKRNQKSISKEILDDALQNEIRERNDYDRFYASQEWKILRERFLRTHQGRNGVMLCYYCHCQIEQRDITVDHFKPRSKFPELALEITNLRLACRSCNSSKGNKVMPMIA